MMTKQVVCCCIIWEGAASGLFFSDCYSFVLPADLSIHAQVGKTYFSIGSAAIRDKSALYQTPFRFLAQGRF